MSMNDDPEDGAAPDALLRHQALVRRKNQNRWSAAKEDIFFEELAATCNISHAAARAGMHVRSAYHRKYHNPAFAARWVEAMDAGYTELEALMLRQAIQGAERTETVRGPDGAVRQVKTVRTFPHAAASRLLGRHHEQMERYRAMQAMRFGDNPKTMIKIRAELARVRSRLIEGGVIEGDAVKVEEEREAPDG